MHLLPETLQYWIQRPLIFFQDHLQSISMKCIDRKEVKEYTMGFREVLGTAKLQHKPGIEKEKVNWFFLNLHLGNCLKC